MKKAKCDKNGINVPGSGGSYPWMFFMVIPFHTKQIIFAFRELTEEMPDMDIHDFGIVSPSGNDKGKLLTYTRYGEYSARPTINLLDPTKHTFPKGWAT